MNAPTFVTKTFLQCPACGMWKFTLPDVWSPSVVAFGPWSCLHNGCRARVSGTVADGIVGDVTWEPREQPGWALLRYGDLLLLVEEKYGRVDDWDFFYHSHQCPVNVLRNAVQVFHATEGRDPHGAFEYVAGIPSDETTDELVRTVGSTEELLELFETDGQPKPGAMW